MGKERRVTREDAEDFMAQIRRATESGANNVKVSALGAELVFSRMSDGGFTFQTSDGSVSSRFHQPSESRPTGYPDSVPFIPNEPVSLSSTMNTMSLVWFTPADAEGLFTELNRLSASEGWELKEKSEFTQVPARHSDYEANGFSRSILLSGGIVTLVQSRGKP
jgi:hypothetical protein